MIEPERDYTPKELAAELGCNVETVRRWIRENKLLARRKLLTKSYVVRGADVLTFVARIEARTT